MTKGLRAQGRAFMHPHPRPDLSAFEPASAFDISTLGLLTRLWQKITTKHSE